MTKILSTQAIAISIYIYYGLQKIAVFSLESQAGTSHQAMYTDGAEDIYHVI